MEKISVKSKKNFFLIFNLILAVITMSCSLIVAGRITKDDSIGTSSFLMITILTLTVLQGMLILIYTKKKDRIRLTIIGIIYIIASVFAFVARYNYVFFYISTIVVILNMALNQVLLIAKETTKKGITLNIIIAVTLLALSIALIIYIKEEYALKIVFIDVILFLINSLKRLLSPSLKVEKIKLLVNIVIKTHSIDVIISLISFIIAFSFIFVTIEPSMSNYWDAIWYCFSVVTTVGFGDYTAVTTLGRILTVVLGLYGIVVVAILTSVIVNFYNEVTAKEKKRDIIE